MQHTTNPFNPRTIKALSVGAAALISLILTSCTTTGSTNTREPQQAQLNLFQSAIKQRCQSEIERHPYWQIASHAMNQQTKQNVSERICGCVGQKSLQQLSLGEITTAATNAQERPRLVRKAVLGSLQACAADYLNQR